MIPSDKKAASTDPYYKGKDQSVFAVGRGQHDDQFNSTDVMRWAQTRTASVDDNQGFIMTQKVVTNSGDSGGPLFRYEGQTPYVVGVLKGASATQSTYSSVGKHALFIIKHQYNW
jgi:V8-like Glu-specific endopeptidase